MSSVFCSNTDIVFATGMVRELGECSCVDVEPNCVDVEPRLHCEGTNVCWLVSALERSWPVKEGCVGGVGGGWGGGLNNFNDVHAPVRKVVWGGWGVGGWA